MGQILAEDKAQAVLQAREWARSREQELFGQPRIYRVGLAKERFYELELVGTHPRAAAEAAVARAAEAATLFTTPISWHRIAIQQRADPRDRHSPLIWVPVEYGATDPFDRNAPWCWHLKPTK